MKIRNRMTVWLALVSIVSVTAILVNPGTRWIVSLQIRNAVGILNPFNGDVGTFDLSQTADPAETLSLKPPATLHRYAEVVAEHRGDIDLSLGYAGEWATQRVRPGDRNAATQMTDSRPVDAAFEDLPATPPVAAEHLRYLCENVVVINRPDLDRVISGPGKVASKPVRLAKPADIESSLLAVTRGEAADPDNAFFPLMRAAICFARGDDVDAFTAIRRAADCGQYDDYLSAEADSRWRLGEAAAGRQLSFQRLTTRLMILDPHYSTLRNVARMTLASAIGYERYGDVARGIRLRHALMTVGARVRDDSSFMLGSQVGVAIVAIAASRPAGVPPAGHIDQTAEERERVLVSNYREFLLRNNEQPEADWATNQLKIGEQTSGAVHKIYASEQLFSGDRLVAAVLYDYAISVAALGAFLWLLWFIVRTRLSDEGRARGARRALAAILSASFPLLGWLLVRNVVRGGLVGVVATGGSIAAPVTIVALPLALEVALGLTGLACRVGFFVAIGRGMKALAPPVALCLLLVYSGAVAATGIADARAEAALDRMSVSELREMAAEKDIALPDVVGSRNMNQ